MLAKQVEANKKDLASSTVVLKKISDDLKKFDAEASYSVSYSDKTYTKKDDLDKLAKRAIEAHKSLAEQTQKMESRLETFEQTATTLETRHAEAKAKLREMKDQLKELDAKIEMVKAQKEAAEALNESDKSFADSIKGIEDKIKNLDASTETAVRKEAEKWNEMSAKTEVEDATKIIKDSKSTADEIDALLGKVESFTKGWNLDAPKSVKLVHESFFNGSKEDTIKISMYRGSDEDQILKTLAEAPELAGYAELFAKGNDTGIKIGGRSVQIEIDRPEDYDD
jgi:phage shock protein A